MVTKPDLLARLQKWRNGDCGGCKKNLNQLVGDMEDTLTTLSQLVGATKRYRAADPKDEERFIERRNAIVVQALTLEAKINGTD